MPAVTHPIVGQVSYLIGPNRSLLLPKSWIAKNITAVYVPQLVGVPTYGGRCEGTVSWHRSGVHNLLEAFAALEDAELLHYVRFFGGTWVQRLIRGSNQPSNHSFGTAIDLNCQGAHNAYLKAPEAPGTPWSLHEVAEIWKDYGFDWGGSWRRRPDGMHFELKSLKITAESTYPPECVISIDTKTTLKGYLIDGHVYASAKALLTALVGEAEAGKALAWYPTTKVLTMKGRPLPYNLIAGQAYVQASAVCENVGAPYLWHKDTRTLVVSIH